MLNIKEIILDALFEGIIYTDIQPTNSTFPINKKRKKKKRSRHHGYRNAHRTRYGQETASVKRDEKGLILKAKPD